MRTFISIDLNQELKNVLYRFIQEMDTGEKNVRWVKPKGMHLTLKFLGEIAQKKVEEIGDLLETVSKDYRPFTLKIQGTGTFPPGVKNPRVLWVGIEKDETLMALQSRLERELEKLDFPREKRMFHPHLTLGRVKAPYNLNEILFSLENNRQRIFGEMKATKITFFHSVLKPSGAEYFIISEFSFK